MSNYSQLLSLLDEAETVILAAGTLSILMIIDALIIGWRLKRKGVPL